MTQSETSPESVDLPEGSWMVAVGPEDVRVLTLDELDEAYQDGWVTEDTLVWTHDMEEWLPLQEAAGGDDEPEEAETQPHPEAAPLGTGFETAQSVPSVAPGQSVPPQSVPPQAVPPQSLPAQSLPAQSLPAQAVPPQSVPSQQVAAAQAVAPVQSVTPASPGPAIASTAPVAFDLDELAVDDPDAFGKKKSRTWIWVAAAVVVLAGGGLTFMNLGTGGEQPTPVAAAAAPAPPSDDIQVVTPEKVDPNAPLEVSGGGYQVSAAEERAFKDESKKAQQMREKMQAALAGKEQEKKSPARSGAAPRRQKAAPSKPLPKGKGSSYDPLNGSLP